MVGRPVLPELPEPVTYVDRIVERLELECRQQSEPRSLAQFPERGHGHARRSTLGCWRVLQQPIDRPHPDLAKVAVKENRWPVRCPVFGVPFIMKT